MASAFSAALMIWRHEPFSNTTVSIRKPRRSCFRLATAALYTARWRRGPSTARSWVRPTTSRRSSGAPIACSILRRFSTCRFRSGDQQEKTQQDRAEVKAIVRGLERMRRYIVANRDEAEAFAKQFLNLSGREARLSIAQMCNRSATAVGLPMKRWRISSRSRCAAPSRRPEILNPATSSTGALRPKWWGVKSVKK